MVLKRLFFTAMLVSLLDVVAHAQSGSVQVKVHGVILDSISATPISDVHITINECVMVSSGSGQFNISVMDGDTIFFSHVSYKPLLHIYKQGGSAAVLTIMLTQEVQVLHEVTFSDFYSEDEFKSKLLETEPKISREQQLVNENSERIKGFAKYAAPMPTLNEQFYDQMKGPQGSTLFSSDPSKGLIKAIKNIFSPDTYSPLRIVTKTDYKYNPLLFRKTLISKDTMRTDTLLHRPGNKSAMTDTTKTLSRGATIE